jgi:predicted nucleotidyltransferase
MNRLEVLNTLKKFKQNNKKNYNILLLGIFGSVARNEASNNSDIDIVIKTKTADPYNIVHIKEDLELLLHKHVDIVRLRDKMNISLKKKNRKRSYLCMIKN